MRGSFDLITDHRARIDRVRSFNNAGRKMSLFQAQFTPKYSLSVAKAAVLSSSMLQQQQQQQQGQIPTRKISTQQTRHAGKFLFE